ncbi:DUF3265 domain-containing protein [Vibrio vulnificus]|nr:DUF3265 domain-containing protein [Vibrio vulnificus]
MTKRLRGIWHAWHFRFALGSVIKSLCGSFCSACLHPLTRRYVSGGKYRCSIRKSKDSITFGDDT